MPWFSLLAPSFRWGTFFLAFKTSPLKHIPKRFHGRWNPTVLFNKQIEAWNISFSEKFLIIIFKHQRKLKDFSLTSPHHQLWYRSELFRLPLVEGCRYVEVVQTFKKTIGFSEIEQWGLPRVDMGAYGCGGKTHGNRWKTLTFLKGLKWVHLAILRLCRLPNKA